MTKVMQMIIDDAITEFGFEDENVILLCKIAEEEVFSTRTKEDLMRKMWKEMTDPVETVLNLIEEAYLELHLAVTDKDKWRALDLVIELEGRLQELMAAID